VRRVSRCMATVGAGLQSGSHERGLGKAWPQRWEGQVAERARNGDEPGPIIHGGGEGRTRAAAIRDPVGKSTKGAQNRARNKRTTKLSCTPRHAKQQG